MQGRPETDFFGYDLLALGNEGRQGFENVRRHPTPGYLDQITEGLRRPDRLSIDVKEVRVHFSDMSKAKRCAVCDSEEVTAYPLDLPDQLGKWKFLLADKVVYCCSNGHRFLMLPGRKQQERNFPLTAFGT